MQEFLLGLDSGILAQTSPREQGLYRLSLWLFAGVSLSMLMADAYFGQMFVSGLSGVFFLGAFMGYIHFAFYRLAMITLTTRPLSEKSVPPAGPFIRLQNRLVPDASSLFRLIFVGLIALSVSFPGAALFYHREAEQIQSEHRMQLMAGIEAAGIGSHLCPPDARFPFLVFGQLWKSTGYRLLVLLWAIWIFTPLLLLTRLRYGSAYEYDLRLAGIHREMVERDYHTQILEAEEKLRLRFGQSLRPQELNAYEDPPFNTRFRNRKDRQFGDHVDFALYLNSLKKG
jgi:hypothetical protein